MGPNWYWRRNAEAILRHGYSKAGKITRHAFKYQFEANEEVSTAAGLEGHYALIEQIVRKVMSAHEHHNPVFEAEARPYTEDEIVAEYKGLIPAMQGSWTDHWVQIWGGF